MKRFFLLMFIIGMLGFLFLMPWNSVRVEAHSESTKSFKTYVVEQGDTLWDIAVEHMGTEYESVHCYIDEIMDLNSLDHTGIRQGQVLALPYYTDMNN